MRLILTQTLIALTVAYNLVKPLRIKKTKKPVGGLQWDKKITWMVLKLLSHRTPPSCIAPNILILTLVQTICPNSDVVVDLPGVSFIRQNHSVLLYLTKMLAAYQLAKAYTYLQHNSDGT